MYSRTDNGDGSLGSRCLDCLMTVARNVHSPEILDRIERRHICLEKALFQLMQLKKNGPDAARVVPKPHAGQARGFGQ